MNIYLFTRNGPADYDEYAGFVVVAESMTDARRRVRGEITGTDGSNAKYDGSRKHFGGRLLGTADAGQEEGIVLSDFRAG